MPYKVISECVNHTTRKRYHPGDEFPDDHPHEAARLIKAKCLQPIESQQQGITLLSGETGPVDIPADWKDAHHSTKRSLAKKLSGEDPADTASAEAVIEAEVARRAAATPPVA